MSRYYRLCIRLYNITGFSIHVLSNPPSHLTGASFVKYSKIVERTYVSSYHINQSNHKPQFQNAYEYLNNVKLEYQTSITESSSNKSFYIISACVSNNL